jgi:cysteine desulfurase
LVETGVSAVGGSTGEPAGEVAPDRSGRLPGHCHVCIEGADSESLLFLLEQAGVMASAASSCASGAMAGSHVLAAMGVAPALAAGSLRLTLGPDTTAADVDVAVEAVAGAVERLRRFPRAS